MKCKFILPNSILSLAIVAGTCWNNTCPSDSVPKHRMTGLQKGGGGWGRGRGDHMPYEVFVPNDMTRPHISVRYISMSHNVLQSPGLYKKAVRITVQEAEVTVHQCMRGLATCICRLRW